MAFGSLNNWIALERADKFLFAVALRAEKYTVGLSLQNSFI